MKNMFSDKLNLIQPVVTILGALIGLLAAILIVKKTEPEGPYNVEGPEVAS